MASQGGGVGSRQGRHETNICDHCEVAPPLRAKGIDGSRISVMVELMEPFNVEEYAQLIGIHHGPHLD